MHTQIHQHPSINAKTVKVNPTPSNTVKLLSGIKFVSRGGAAATHKKMGIDYYAVLNVCRDASDIEIKLAYRKWATLSHPDHRVHACNIRNPPDAIACNRPCPGISKECYWLLLNEAFDVLTNEFYREIFDVHGEEGLKRGVPTKHCYFPGYSYHGNCRKTYESVFGTYSPYADIIDAVTNPPPLVRMADGNVCTMKKDADVERLLYVDLSDVFYGGIKKMKILRHEFVDDMRLETKIRENFLDIPIPPGVLPGTAIRFVEAGDRGAAIIPADVVFIVADKKHEIFTRDGPDLHVTQLITLRQALCGLTTTITTIDDRQITFTINEVIE